MEKYTKNQINLYCTLTDIELTNADEIINTLELPKLAGKKSFSFILSHYDLRMPTYFTFSPEEIADAIHVTNNQASTILGLFSYKLGGLKDHKTEHFFLDNPIWEKPLLKISDTSYFCSIPQVFFSFILVSLNSLIETINDKKLIERRANYLENKIEEIVKRRFPSALTVSGVKWKQSDRQYESDLITFIDSHAIIIEAKSHKITKPALRGASQRIKRHIEEIIIEPSIQSYRFERYLNELSKEILTSDEFLQQQLPVNIKNIKKIIRVSVSLENFTVVQTNLKPLIDTGWNPEDYQPCPSMNLADFETLFDLLEHPVQIIHYLTQRSSFQSKISFLGDELDLLGLYLGTLLNMGNLQEKQNTQIMISQMSSSIDHYYDSKGQGIEIPKPQPKISKLFQEIFSKLEERNTPRWTEIGVLLNMLTPDDQLELEKSICRYKAIVNRTWQKEGHHNTIIYVPPNATDFALAYILLKNENLERRDEYVENAIYLSLEPDHVRSALIIAKNIDDDSLPYHFIALTEKEPSQ